MLRVRTRLTPTSILFMRPPVASRQPRLLQPGFLPSQAALLLRVEKTQGPLTRSEFQAALESTQELAQATNVPPGVAASRAIERMEDLMLYCLEEGQEEFVCLGFRELSRRNALQPQHFGIMAELYRRRDDFDMVLSVLKVALERGLADQLTPHFSMMIHHFGNPRSSQSTSLERFRELVSLMEIHGVPHDDRTAANVVDGFVKLGDLESAENMFKRVESREIDLPLSVIYFNSLIHGYASRGDVENAMKWYHRLLTTSIRPNARTFGKLLSTFKNSSSSSWKAFLCHILDDVAAADIDVLGNGKNRQLIVRRVIEAINAHSNYEEALRLYHVFTGRTSRANHVFSADLMLAAFNQRDTRTCDLLMSQLLKEKSKLTAEALQVFGRTRGVELGLKACDQICRLIRDLDVQIEYLGREKLIEATLTMMENPWRLNDPEFVDSLFVSAPVFD